MVSVNEIEFYECGKWAINIREHKQRLHLTDLHTEIGK